MITVLGGDGFLGSRFAARLARDGTERWVPARNEALTGRRLGTVLYCIGVTADFRTRPFDTVEAHVGRLAEVLRDCDFERLVYLSSTRVYRLVEGEAAEDAALPMRPEVPEDLYALSKAMGESLALSCGRDAVVVRLSNVYGPGARSEDFLPSVLAAARAGRVVLRQSLESDKDYVSVDDVVAAVLRVASSGRQRVYNVAAGENTSHGRLLARLKDLTGCAVEVVPDAPTVRFPRVATRRLTAEFGYNPARLMDDLPGLLRAVPEPERRS